MRKTISHGTADQMLAAFEKRVDELEGNVDAASRIEAADDLDLVEYLSPEDEERYIHTLVGDTNSELEDLDIFDSWTWDYDTNNITLTTVKDTQIEEYTIPRKDLKFNWDNIEEDVQYIMQAVIDIEMDDEAAGEYYRSIESAEDVVGATINDSGDDNSVVIPEYAKTEFYADSQGGFGGDENDVYSLEDIMIMWNSEHNNDPSMSVYDSFNEWWEDTRSFMKRVAPPAVNSDDDERFTDPQGFLGLDPEETVSKGEMRKYFEENPAGDPSLAEYASFEEWWAKTESMLQPVESATISASYDGYVYPPGPIYEVVDMSQLPDDVTINDYTIQGDIYLVELDRELTLQEMKKYNAEPMKYHNNYSDPAEYCVHIENASTAGSAVTASYSPFTLDELVNYYSQQDMMTDEEIWDEIVAQYHDEDLANDVVEAL